MWARLQPTGLLGLRLEEVYSILEFGVVLEGLDAAGLEMHPIRQAVIVGRFAYDRLVEVGDSAPQGFVPASARNGAALDDPGTAMVRGDSRCSCA